MTENEAKERLECMRLFMQIEDAKNESKFLEDDYVANKMAIQALEEIQQYRELGTVEEILKVFNNQRTIIATQHETVKQYRAIGTIEEFKRAKRIESVYGQVKWERYIAISQLEEIGVGLGQKMDEFKALKEKSVAKKPRFYAHNYYCTECGNLVGNNEFEWQRFLYCDKCGRKLDW